MEIAPGVEEAPQKVTEIGILPPPSTMINETLYIEL